MKSALMASASLALMCATAVAEPSNIDQARKAIVDCVSANIKAFLAVPDAQPIGVAFFVGLSCSLAREQYAKFLRNSADVDADLVLQRLDAGIVNQVLSTWSDARSAQ